MITKKNVTEIIMGLSIFMCVFGCAKDETKQPLSVEKYVETVFKEISRDKLKDLTLKRIYFGHQSVGFDIIRGIELLQEQYAFDKFVIFESKDSDAFSSYRFFGHNRIGKNGSPKEKLDAFTAFIDTTLNGNVDIAFLKFCYSDIFRDTDIEDVFQYYVSEISLLSEKYPHIKFLHVTVPLRKNKSGIRSFLSGIIGRNHNIRREQYNDLIRKHYDRKEVFDLAAYEYQYPDGRIEKNLAGVKSIIPAYTYDGGHLTDTGAKVMAAELLRLMAD